jgi:hypothetical protein
MNFDREHQARVAFCAARGWAVQAYASFEQSLCGVFANVSGMPRLSAGIVFFKIASAHTLHKILLKLIEKKHGKSYSVFWRSLLGKIASIGDKRNSIVHWNMVTEVGGSENVFSLRPPDIYNWTGTADERITTADMTAFATQCDFLAGLCSMFDLFTDAQMPRPLTPEARQAWPDVFVKPVVYPLPSDHPLYTAFPATASA